MNGLTKTCMVISTISLALLAAETWLWTLIDLSNNEDDIYEMHLQMHEEMDAQQALMTEALKDKLIDLRDRVDLLLIKQKTDASTSKRSRSDSNQKLKSFNALNRSICSKISLKIVSKT